jgi:riboflavin biosynthesis pyrimidine reductase
MRRLFPDAVADLDDAGLAAAYRHPGGGRFVRMNFVASVDGAVTLDGRSGPLGTPADLRVFDLLRDLCDVVLVGAGTVRVEGYGPPEFRPARRARRRAAGLADVPPYAVVSGSLQLDPRWAVFTAAEARTIVITRAAAPADRRAALGEVADVIVAGDEQVDLAAAADQLAARGLHRVLCEGGPRLFGTLLTAGLVDELCLTVTPLLTGTGPGRIVAGPPLTVAERHAVGLDLGHVLTEDGALFLRYAVKR